MTSAQVVEKSVTNNKNRNRNDHTIRTTEYAGFKAFSMKTKSGNREKSSELRGAGRKEKSYPIFFRDDQQLRSKVKVTFLVNAVLGIKRIAVAQGLSHIVYLTTQYATEG